MTTTRDGGGKSGAERDPEEFIRLLEGCKSALYRFARGAVWDRNRVEDVLQEAMLEGYRSFPRFELGTNFRAWMMLILARTIYARNKQFRRQIERETPVDGHDLDVQVASPPGKATADALPKEDLDRWLEDTSEEVKRAVEDLPETQRTVFLLRAAEGLSYQEVADALDIPIGTVMSHLARARVKLRERLYDHARDLGLTGGRLG